MFCHVENENVRKKVRIALVLVPARPPIPTTPAPSPPPVFDGWPLINTIQPNLNLVATMSDEQQEEV